MNQDHILLLSLILILQIFLISKVFRIRYFFSPIYVALGFYLITGVSGYLVYSINPDFVSFGYTSISLKLTPEDCVPILQYFLIFINQISFGALSFLFLGEVIHGTVRSSRHERFSNQVASLDNTSSNISLKPTHDSAPHLKPAQKASERKDLSGFAAKGLHPNLLILLCMVPTVLLMAGIGPEKIFSRESYQEFNIRILLSLGNISILPAAMGLGYNLANKASSLNRLACLLLIAVDFLTLFSLATRALAIFPILITFGYWFNKNRKKGLGIFLCILTALLFSPLIFLPLYLRASPSHGLFPYLGYASELDLATLFQAPIGFISNFLFSFPLVGEILKQKMLKNFPIDYLLISISPLPGSWVGWYAINKILRLNDATPFNTIGEMYLYGDAIGFGLFFSLGVMLIFISLVFEKCLKRFRAVYALILLMLVLLFTITSLQYNLRSATRILYLALALACLFWF